jgi:UDP-GlcNAc:undecaprenyl-phosphate GlcNAc-1-phosphate transferase
VSAVAALLACPAAALVLYGLLRSPAATRLVSAPRADRWHEQTTPNLGGIGIFAGLLVGILVALALGAVPLDTAHLVPVDLRGQLLWILGGCAVLFVAGLVDDVYSLPPLAKIVAQVGAAGLVLAGGLKVELVSNDLLASVLAVIWIVGMTNAFNLLDNMDGLAASLAGVAAFFFAVDAAWVHPNHVVLVLALALLGACAGFLPFNLRRTGRARVFMGDSGSQVLGFALATCGLAATWQAAGTTVATLILPLLVLAVPILDTTLVTVVRLFEGRPIYQGGRDHTSHRLVYHGLSDRRAVILLATISVALGATSLAYSVIDDAKTTAIGVMLTFALIVQFASFLGDAEQNATGVATRRQGFLRSVVYHRRRFVEVVVDAVLITVSLYGAYVLRLGSNGTPSQQRYLVALIPVLLFARYAAFIPFGLYRGVWRYSDARDAVRVAAAVLVSEVVAYGFMAATRYRGDFPRATFVIDALLCTLLIGGSRLWERAAYRGVTRLRALGPRRRVLLVGAGRHGRSLARELRETAGEHVVGFVDDDPRLWRRRVIGVPVLGSTDEMTRIVVQARPDIVYVTIAEAPSERLDFVREACGKAGIECRFVRREIDPDPWTSLSAGRS